MKIKYIRYRRKSSETEERQVLSIESQRESLDKIFPNLEVVEDLTEAKSAFHPDKRIVFNHMIALLKAKKANGIIAWHPDRLSRNEIDAATITYLIRTGFIQDIKFGSYTFDNSPEGIMMLQMSLSQSQYFSSKLGKDVKRGLKTKAEQGWFPEHAPLGYRNTPDRKKGYRIIVNDNERFHLVQRLFKEIVKGKQASQVYREAIKDWKLTGKTGRPIVMSSFYNILNNPFYYGEYEYPKKSGNWHKGKHQPMITKEEFDIVQKMLGKHGKPVAHNHNFDLTGLFRCEKCKYAITATKKVKHYKKTGNTGVYTYYHCSKKSKTMKCNAKPISEKNITKQIKDLLLTVRPDIEFIVWAKKWLRALHEYESHNQESVLASQNKALESVENRLNRLLDLRLNDELDNAVYASKKKELEQEKSAIKEKLANTDEALDGWRVKVENALDFAYACQLKFKKGTRDEKHEVMVRLSSNLFLGIDKRLMVQLKNEFEVLADKDNWDKRYEGWVEPQEYTDIMAKSPDLRPAIPAWLERWYEFGRIDWVEELEYPEWTAKEVERFLSSG